MKLTRAQKKALKRYAHGGLDQRNILGSDLATARALRDLGLIKIDPAGTHDWSHGVGIATDAGFAALEDGRK